MPTLTLPSDPIIWAAGDRVTKVTRRVEICESDGSTVWRDNPGITSGSVTIDQARDERWSLSIEFDNTKKDLRTGVGGLWYDKIIKVYRGIVASDGTSWERQLGEYFIDNVSEPHFPNKISVTARDRTKLLLKSKFAAAITFPNAHPVEEIVRTIAFNGGVPMDRILLPLTGVSTTREYSFDSSVERWNAIKDLCIAYNFEVYFDNVGRLRMTPYSDPALDTPQHVFRADDSSNLASFSKSANDSRLFNHVVVSGDDPQNLIWAEALLTDPNHPARIAKIGQRTAPEYKSAFISNQAQAQAIADSFLTTYAMESYEVSLGAVVAPWLDVGIIMQFLDPDPGIGDPTLFLLSSITMPLNLAPMNAVGKRIVAVV